MTTEVSNTCPCQSGKDYQHCCAIIHKDQRNTEFPVLLMRARYCAYCLHQEGFILNSWAFETRPEHIELSNTARWLSLTISDADQIFQETVTATVTYRATFIDRDKLITLQERSNFIKRANCWFYLDGEPHYSDQRLAGNAKCPCGSGKKYKRCCISSIK